MVMEKELDREPDCVHCMGLCCLASSFKKSEHYAFSKTPANPAGIYKIISAAPSIQI